MKSGKKEEIEQAKEIANKFPNNAPIQSQLITIYMKSGKKEEIEQAKEIASKFPNDEPIQSQLMTIYIKSGKVEELEDLEELRQEQRIKIDDVFLEQMDNKEENILSLIRAKLYVGTINNDDIQVLQQNIEQLERKQYYLILIAIYEKIGQKNNALKILKQMEEEGIKLRGLSEIKERLKSKKQKLYDLGKWDEIIGWETVITPQYEKERKILEKANEEEIKETKICKTNYKDETGKNQIREKQKINNDSLDENKKEGQRIIIKSTDKSNDTPIVEKKKKNIIKQKKKVIENKTIFSTLNESLKETIDEINRNYYVKMQPKTIKSSRVKEYQQLLLKLDDKSVKNKKELMTRIQEILKEIYEENDRQKRYINKYDKLQSILSCKSDNKRAQMELILVLINEGYTQVVEKEFPEDYEFVNKIIKEYRKKSIKLEETKKQIDEYCR